jgi:hypothetical protein
MESLPGLQYGALAEPKPVALLPSSPSPSSALEVTLCTTNVIQVT